MSEDIEITAIVSGDIEIGATLVSLEIDIEGGI